MSHDRPAQIILVRHGQSLLNVAKKTASYFANNVDRNKSGVEGIADEEIPLTPIGARQAKMTGAFLAKHFPAPHYVYHSDYERTRATTRLILDAFPKESLVRMKVRHSPAIREREPGYTYNMTVTEAETHFPWLQPYWQTTGPFYARPPGGESMADVTDRAHRFLSTLFRDRVGMNILVVTHGNTIRALRFLLERWTTHDFTAGPGKPTPKNCGIFAYSYDPLDRRFTLTHDNVACYEKRRRKNK
jgi:2,3-bisphosphoglycerate-dependent phosphoglycerate mutase